MYNRLEISLDKATSITGKMLLPAIRSRTDWNTESHSNSMTKTIRGILFLPLPITSVLKFVFVVKASVPKPSDCQDVYSKVSTQSGVYRIYPDGSHSIEVYCEQRLDGGGWTVSSGLSWSE